MLDELPESDAQKALLKKFKAQFEARYGFDVGGLYAEAYDNVLLIARGLETAGDNREKLRDAVEQVKGLVGMSGVFTMSATDHNGLTSKDLVIGQVKNGKWTIVK